MMSDHWKLLANILGTPGPAEPAAKEPTKKKSEFSSEENKSIVNSPDGNPVPRDPLADLVIRNPEPVVPGFDVPAPAPVVEKPAKRSAWDTLIGTLGIKSASDHEPLADEPVAARPAPPIQSAPASRHFAGELDSPAQRSEERPVKRGFGAGLVDSLDHGDSVIETERELPRPMDSAPARIPSFRESEPRESNHSRSRGDSRTNVSRPAEPRSSESGSSGPSSLEGRSREPRSSETRQPDSRPSDSRQSDSRRRSEPRQGDSRNRDSRPRDARSDEPAAPRRNDLKKDSPTKSRGFSDGIGDGDGILDWDVDQDDVFLRDDDLIDDGVDSDEQASAVDRPVAPPRSRDDEDRPRGRGRRGGSRNRGRGDIRSDETVGPVNDDLIGWNVEIANDGAEPIRPQAPRSESGRGAAPRDVSPRREDGRDSSRGGRGREPRRDTAPRGDARQEPIREETRRDLAPARESQRREPVRDEVRRDVPPRDLPRRQDETEDAISAEGGRRTGRRGQRQQMGAGPASPRVSREEPSRLPDVDLDYDDLMSEELPSSPAVAPTSESGEGPTRPRRRRGRRGRGGSNASESTASDREPIDRSRPAVEIGFGEIGFAAELSPDAIDSVELNDDHEDDEEVEQIRRGRRRGRGRGEPRERTETVGNVDSLPPAGFSAEEAVSKNRGVPTWLDTVSLLVEPNIERHRRTGSTRAPQGRGGRR